MTARVAAVAALVAVLAAVALLLLGGGSEQRTLRAAFDRVENVIPGLEVRAAGQQVGEITEVKRVGGHAQLELEISDDAVWPLPRGTVVRLRHGTTIGYSARFVELLPADPGGPPLPSGAMLDLDETSTPVEFDEIFRIFDREGRGRLRAYLRSGDAALRGRGRSLGRGIEAGAGGFDALADLVSELDGQRDALSVLVAAGSRTAEAVARRDADLERLVSGLASSYEQLARARPATTETLARLPGVLATARRTLARTDPSIVRLRSLTDALAPGAADLPELARDTSGVLSRLRRVAPRAETALRHGARAMPALEGLLEEGAPFSDDLGEVLGRVRPMVSCLRPYAPEIIGFFGTWAGVGMNYDAADHHTRTLGQVNPMPNGYPFSSEELIATTPGVDYAFPRPPGYNVGQPWFLPRCGVGPESLDPSQDPEARAP